MTTLLYSHPACIAHDPGAGHPECPARLEAVLEALEAPEFAALERREAPRADQAQIARVHGADYVAAVLAARPVRARRRCARPARSARRSTR
jgi:acetoin utilization deacetylase AcuC-like enzyme